MASKDLPQQENKLKNATKWGLYGIGLQFVLGTVVSLWHIPPSEETATHKSPAFASLSFDLHMLLALILVLWSIYLLAIALKTKKAEYKKLSIACLGSIIVAFVGGISIFFAPDSWARIGLFIMGLGFIGAFFNYGRLYLKLK
jgi:hypothetical protein